MTLTDTDAATMARMDTSYRQMTPAEKLQRVRDLTKMADRLSLAGLRARHPDDSAVVLSLRLARIRLGPDLFDRAYPGALEAHGR
ncbi:MAG: hypothetical protein HKN72_08285 [Gemmatimonadetes bacterium]|nr:hypothetical protein [Gemmatimonadota bacterium]